MEIVKVDIENFRALKSISVPVKRLSVILGENDVGKTSFLYAIQKFFERKKMKDPNDWFKRNTLVPIIITVSFKAIPMEDSLSGLVSDNIVTFRLIFGFNENPIAQAISSDGVVMQTLTPAFLNTHISSDKFHLIPVRRDMSVQFSMNKTALLGKLLRARMMQALQDSDASISVNDVKERLALSIEEPSEQMENFLREQLSNDELTLGFDDLNIDPTEGVRFSVTLSDTGLDNVDMANRGAGTQNNLIIALFRLIAASNVDGIFIFAMEEPENSLHPKAQRQLFSVIQEISQSIQVIVTSHSPVFIDRSNFESNILLSRALSGVTLAKTFQCDDMSDVRTDLGIRASDALLKGGGNCAILVEGKTEEEGFPVFLEMLNLSEFQLGIAIINMGGSDFIKASGIIKLLRSYNIPCVVVLDRDAQVAADDLERAIGGSLHNLKKVFCLEKGTIEDYYPESIVADVINNELKPSIPVRSEELEGDWSGGKRLEAYKRIMYEHGLGDSLDFLKVKIGQVGTKSWKGSNRCLDPELERIFRFVEQVVSES